MNIEITARHFTASDYLKELINEKLIKMIDNARLNIMSRLDIPT